ncbi:MAG: flagellar hook-associated protein FlgK [Deltaproteobacteria bacterium]|nr:flagellar hook-associated protein FlgK [Deltaproteobacteria bacterium]
MANISSLLVLGGNAVLAQNAGIATTGKNIANVNTEGYQRERIDLASLPGAPNLGGVRVIGPYRTEDLLLARREQLAMGDRGLALSASSSLSSLEDAIGGATSHDLIDAMGAFFAGVSELISSPLDLARRQSVVNQADQVARIFRRVASEIQGVRTDADGRIYDMSGQANKLAAEIASLNKEMVINRNDPVLADKRDLAAKKLSELIGGQARIDPDGMLRFVVGGGVVVVDGARAATVEAVVVSGTFRSVRVVDGAHVEDITTRVGGKIGGEVRVRDTIAATAATDVDQLAVDFSSALNTQHSAGEGLDGTSGRLLFTNSAGAAVTSASDMNVYSVILADPRRIAVAAAGSGAGSGNNANALAMAALRNSLIASSSTRTAVDEAIRIIGAVGLARANYDRDVQVENARVDALAQVRDSLSGVSIQEEMSRLSHFRAAAEAAAKFVQTVDSLLQVLVERL